MGLIWGWIKKKVSRGHSLPQQQQMQQREQEEQQGE
jgi:hypothetical protein